MEETACTCDTCKSMCLKQPCLGTPEDIAKLFEAGHNSKLARSVWMVGLVTGTVDRPIDMIQPLADETGKCSFLDDNGLCTLHDSGLKPTEGKLSHHTDGENFTGDFRDTINYKVAMSWVDINGNNNPTSILVNIMANKSRIERESRKENL